MVDESTRQVVGDLEVERSGGISSVHQERNIPLAPRSSPFRDLVPAVLRGPRVRRRSRSGKVVDVDCE